MTCVDKQSAEFRAAIGCVNRTTPTVPPDAEVRLAVALVVEEAGELVEAILGGEEAKRLKEMMLDLVHNGPLDVKLPAVADALADIDYTVAGARHAFGIDGGPIADAVHEANMRKLAGPVNPATGKKMKPAGWTPPDIVSTLLGQGWKP